MGLTVQPTDTSRPNWERTTDRCQILGQLPLLYSELFPESQLNTTGSFNEGIIVVVVVVVVKFRVGIEG